MRKIAGLVALLTLVCTAGIAGAALASGSNPSFSFSSDESGASWACSVDGGTASSCSSPKSYSNLAPGKHTVTLTSTFTVPTPAPAPSTLVGSASVQSAADSNPGGNAQGWSYTASTSGIAGSVSFYVDSGSSATGVVLGLYADASGTPGKLLGSATVSAPKAAAWNTATLSGGASVASGTKYWLVALGTGGTLNFRDGGSGATGCSTVVSGQTGMTSLPSSFTSGGSWSAYCPSSFYVNGGGTAPIPPAPANTATPVVSGSTAQGSMLTTSNGSWSGSPTSYTYAWEDCNSSGASCASISGATASTYTLANTDMGHTIRAVVTATNAGGSTAATSAATTVVQASPSPPSNTAAPTISGSTTQGSALTATPGTWTGTAPIAYAYQWQRCAAGTCTNISAATSSTYTSQAADVGDTIDVVVSASNQAGSAQGTSSSVGPVTAQQSGQTTNCSPVAGQTMTNTVSHLCGFADTTNTGVPSGTTLYRVPQDITGPTAQTGSGWSWNSTNNDLTVNGGAVLKNVQVSGTITVAGTNATIENSDLDCGGCGWVIDLRHATGVTIKNNNIHGDAASGSGNVCGQGIWDVYDDSDGASFDNNNIWWCTVGMNAIADGGQIEQNYVHDLALQNSSSHVEDIQFEPGNGSLMTVKDNTLLNPIDQTAAIILSNDGGGTEKNRTITHNLLGGGGYTFYGAGGSGTPSTNITFTNNSFTNLYYADSGYFGADTYWTTGNSNIWSGNIWDDTGSAAGP